MALAPDSKLGPYEILAPLGAGGMGEVYRARDPRLGRDVAIKVLPAERMADEERRRRFVQEARAASALNHPNIVTIHEIGSVDGIDFMVMEYVAGKTLDLVIPAHGMRLPQMLQVAIPMADALARAHAAGIVHRDVKPSNVALSDEGLVKVLDFGLAKLVVGRKGAGPKNETQTETGAADALSGAGATAGTVGYMSPEQATGGDVDARSDVFSFGAVLYEMVTGRRAFTGKSTTEVLAAILKDQPTPPSELVPGLPKEVERAIQRCLRKEPERRFQHILDLKLELEQIKEESQSGRVVAVVPARRKRLLWLAAALAGLLGLAAATWRVMRPTEVAPQPPQLVHLTAMRGSERHPRFSPDGEQVVFDWNGEKRDNWDIYIKMVDSPEVRRLTMDAASDVSPSWSPDGKQIAYLRLRADQPYEAKGGWHPATVRVVSPLGGSDRKISDFPTGGGGLAPAPVWSPDGRWLAALRWQPSPDPKAGDGAIFLVPLQGGEPRPLTSPKEPEFHVPGAFDPDGRRFAYLSCDGMLRCSLEIIGLGPGLAASGPPRRLPGRPTFAWNPPVWTRDGKSLVYGDGRTDTLWRVGVAGDLPPERIELAGALAYTPATVASRDRLAFDRIVENADVYRFETGRPSQPVLASTLHDERPDLSPDGRRVVFAQGFNEIWVADSDGTNALRLTGPGNSPRWSPDGRRIAFDTSDEDGQYHVWTVDADGGSRRRLTQDPKNEFQPSWSRDGRFIYFASNRGGPTADIWRVPVAGGGSAERLTYDGNASMPLESADGKTLYFRRGAESENRNGVPLFALPLGGGPARKIVDCVPFDGYAVGRAGIYHFGCREDEAGRPLYLLDLSTGKSQLLGKLERGLGGLAVSPDGKTILYTRLAGEGSDLMMIENFR